MMEKHQRRYLAKWEAKKAKDQEKFEQERKQNAYQETLKRIDQIVREWEPSPNDVFAKARTLLENPAYRPFLYRFIGDDRVFPFMHHYRLMCSKRLRLFMTSVEIIAEIAEEKSWKLESQALQLIPTLVRHQSRIDTIREELLEKATRLRAIQNCLLVKEELMMNVWHPRRIERILDMGGCELLDNLL
jgi:hypothetical protein